MKIKLLSDLHLEGFKFKYNYSGEDVLVLAGDIHTRNRLHEFLKTIPNTLPILFVAGNHEYYNSVFEDVNEYFATLHLEFPNFHFLNNSELVIDNIHFFGGTMYTDFLLNGHYEQWFGTQTCRNINDFYLIKKRSVVDANNICPWTSIDHQVQHRTFCRELRGWLDRTEGKKRVIISHFAPHAKTILPKYKDSGPINSYFTENMENYMGWDGVWAFGHTHAVVDMLEGDTRLVANAKGYGDEVDNFDPEFIVEI